ncbi:MAG TPA: phosphatase PAP2 family protein [Holophagaceae bacterium]
MTLRPSERLTGGTLAALLGLTICVRPPRWPGLASGFGALLVSLVLLARPRLGRFGSLVRAFLPVGAVLGIFLLLQPLLAAVNGHRWDAALAAADTRWFGALARRWQGAFGRPAAFTDLVYAAYASFYLLPLTVAALVWRRRGPAAFERLAFTLLLGFYLSFLGYFLWPAEGPRIPQALESARLGGGPLSAGVRGFLRRAELTTLDAFPSGHTALSLLAAALATRPFPKLAPLFWLWALAIVFATVYISVHYVVDVVAGLLLVPLALFLAPPLRRLLGGEARSMEG